MDDKQDLLNKAAHEGIQLQPANLQHQQAPDGHTYLVNWGASNKDGILPSEELLPEEEAFQKVRELLDEIETFYSLSSRSRLHLMRFEGYQGGMVVDSPSKEQAITAAFQTFDIPRHFIDAEAREDAWDHLENGLPPTRSGENPPVFIRTHPMPVED